MTTTERLVEECEKFFLIDEESDGKDVTDALAAYRAEQAERELPIDEAWLRSIGFTDEESLRYQKKFMLGKSGVLIYSRACEWPKCWTYSIWSGGQQVCESPTRGQLLDIASALMIELKGGDKP